MHEWESQEKLLENWELQEVHDPLKYQEFIYERHEFENIPGVVPRFSIYLSKYIKGLSSFCQTMSKGEPTAKLRSDLESQILTLKSELTEERDRNTNEKSQIHDLIEKLNSVA